jgi:hypothetical protein
VTTEERVHHYGGPWSLTPAQRRRAAKKDREAKRRPAAYVALGDGSFAFLDDRHPAFRR